MEKGGESEFFKHVQSLSKSLFECEIEWIKHEIKRAASRGRFWVNLKSDARFIKLSSLKQLQQEGFTIENACPVILSWHPPEMK